MGFRRQAYRSGLPCPPLKIFLTQGSNPRLLLLLHWQLGSLPLAPPGKSLFQALTAKCPALQCIVAPLPPHTNKLYWCHVFFQTPPHPLWRIWIWSASFYPGRRWLSFLLLLLNFWTLGRGKWPPMAPSLVLGHQTFNWWFKQRGKRACLIKNHTLGEGCLTC